MSTLIVGGGVVGLSIAYGLLKLGKEVLIINDSSTLHGASRGNFGLVWSQGKGENSPEYTRWTNYSIDLWPDFAEELKSHTDIDVMYEQNGGMEYFTNTEKMNSHIDLLNRIQKTSDSEQSFKVLEREDLLSYVPEIGSKVVGATYQPKDGHVNPLNLLRALNKAIVLSGGRLVNGKKVVGINRSGDKYIAKLSDHTEEVASRVIIAAGLGSDKLASMLGFQALIRPVQGQLLITEKLPFFLNFPSINIRQVNEGGVQIGSTESDVGFVDKENIMTISKLAREAIDIFPCLEKVNFLRGWASLRIMTSDGLPIYQESKINPGAFFVTCHSGITLAAIHAGLLPDWVIGNDNSTDLSMFDGERFIV